MAACRRRSRLHRRRPRLPDRTVLYVMLVTMVWRERARRGQPFLARRGRLTLLTGSWASSGTSARSCRSGREPPGGSLRTAQCSSRHLQRPRVPSRGRRALVARRSRDSRRTAGDARRSSGAAVRPQRRCGDPARRRGATDASSIAAGPVAVDGRVHGADRDAAGHHAPAASRPAWRLGRRAGDVRGVGLHFGRHEGNESWWVELVGHQASLPLALAILHQDYRFALADLFLKNAIALLCSWACLAGIFAAAMAPWRVAGARGSWNPQAVGIDRGVVARRRY